MTQQQLQTRLQQAEAETAHLRHVNEALMLGTAEQRHAAAASAVAAAQAQQQQVVAAVTAAGYRWVALDLMGLRSGNLNP